MGSRRIVQSTRDGAKGNVPFQRAAKVCITTSGGSVASVKGAQGCGHNTQLLRLRGPHTRGSVGPNSARVEIPTAAARCVMPESCPTNTWQRASNAARWGSGNCSAHGQWYTGASRNSAVMRSRSAGPLTIRQGIRPAPPMSARAAILTRATACEPLHCQGARQ